MAQIIDGKRCAEQLRRRIAGAVEEMQRVHGVAPGLAVILVGDDPASRVYVRNKKRQTTACGIASFEHHLPAETSEAELLQLVSQLNGDPTVHGILVQLPLPTQIDSFRVIDAIEPDKDVDGFNVQNVGRLVVGAPGLVSCTPLGCMMLLKEVRNDLAGLNAVVVGRSNIVGKPLAVLLLQQHCTVTIAHSRTRDLPELCGRADVLVAAVGRAEMIRGSWIKPGATVIDVGINRLDREEGGGRLVGDVEFAAAADVAGAITPVPGGVGPMTIACLLHNTVKAACSQLDLPFPETLA